MEGVGAVAEPVPPVDTVYHKRLVPVAVNAEAVEPKHKVTGELTVGAEGIGLTVNVAVIVQFKLFLYVIVVVPEDNALTTPAEEIVATVVLEDAQGVVPCAVPVPVNE